MFWDVKQSRSAAGWMWEYHVVQLLAKETGVLSLKPLNNVDNGQPKTLSIPFEISVCYGNRNSLADELLNFVTSKKQHMLLRPGASNQATFDAFAIFKSGMVTLFQITVGEDHSVKESGLDFVWDALDDAKKMAAARKLTKEQILNDGGKIMWNSSL